MRLLAYAMFIFGFIWICFCQFESRAIVRGVLVRQSEKIPKQESYKLEDVQNGIHGAARDMADHIPWFWIGGLIMLGGSMILEAAIRRKRVSQ